MQINELMKNSFWHSETNGTIQIRAVDVAKNELTYITVENLDHAYDDTRVTTTESLESIESKWVISDYDQGRIAEGRSNDPEEPNDPGI